ncbi:hypothetical protein H310_05995 [Aphanomyces invadans]|uniref:PiggyBac transposable element-derived protein domain-containing protein n=1 Tax=Aphanomyces invadans TaxID=157072 RepID=A0A024U7U5_9STRA|nr:hypothetical protein H310_05995 [Aphanomyces invadans]ETW02496.1 hypothetical protein H310_05995 [Aphanomyces invadans]|eukprot:XP_008869101.1 hypothetical protein H310_05995 [Aphanomyces invadans]
MDSVQGSSSRPSDGAAGHVPVTSGAKRVKLTMEPCENTLVAYYREEEDWLRGKEYDGATVLVGLVQRKLISSRFTYLLQWVPLPNDCLLAFDPSNSLHVNTNLTKYFDLNPKVDLLTLVQGRELFCSLGIKNVDPVMVARCVVSPESQDWFVDIPWHATTDPKHWDHDGVQLHVQLATAHVKPAITLEPMAPIDQHNRRALPFPPSLQHVPTSLKVASHDYTTLFHHSAVASFFAYLPITFWEDVVSATNIHGLSTGSITPATAFKLSEVMAYLGILLHVNLYNRFENVDEYWRARSCKVFGGATDLREATLVEPGLSCPRFELLHQVIRCTKFREVTDPLSALRPIVRALQRQCAKTIDPGEDIFVTIDTHVVVDGKHVQLYVVTCATSGVVVHFKLHVANEVHPSALVRNVVEAVHPFHHSHRVVHVHSPFVSVDLVESLCTCGLYCRASTKVPESLVDIAATPNLVATSAQRPTVWAKPIMPTTPLNIFAVTEWTSPRLSLGVLTNRDLPPAQHGHSGPMPSMVKMHLLIDGRRRKLHRWAAFDPSHASAVGSSLAPTSWAHTLMLHLMDIARVNAFLTRKIALPDSDASMWAFTKSLSTELMHGEWEYAPPHGCAKPPAAVPVDEEVPPPSETLDRPCVPRRSKAVFALKRPGKDSRCKTRQCVVCRWESTSKSKTVTEVTDYCDVHDVCLCSCVRQNYTPAPYMCPNTEWTCWEKFHRFYMPEKLFVKEKGARVQRRNWMYKLRHGKSNGANDDQGSDDNAADEPSCHNQPYTTVPRPSHDARPIMTSTSARMAVTVLTRPPTNNTSWQPDIPAAPKRGIQYL